MILELPEGEFDAYVFDCDGTIADTMPLHYQAWCGALKEHQAHFPEAMFYELGGTPTAEIVRILNTRFGWSMPVEETVARKEGLYLAGIPTVKPIEATVKLVKELAGKKPMAVVSGGHGEVVMKTLSALDLLQYFKTVVTPEQIKRGKPHPDGYLEAAHRLNIAPVRCLAFEDTELGAQAARAAGMACVLLPPPERVRELLLSIQS